MPKRRHAQSGFTLVEIAIVLVIIGLLLGGILKGQELINSARVRNLADMSSGIQAAYYGFIDRYRAVPGDMDAASATDAIGQPITGGGNSNGRVDTPAGGNAAWTEANALWEQLSKAGFIQGAYDGTAATEPTLTGAAGNLAPTNVFNSVIVMGRTSDYQRQAGEPVVQRLNLVLGRNVPATIVLELDNKIDDGRPRQGVLRLAPEQADVTVFAGNNNWGATGPGCADVTDPNNEIYDVSVDAPDCNVVFVY